MTEGATALAEIAAPVRQRSLWSDAARRMARNRLAVAGLVVLTLLVLLAVAAPWIAPYSPTEQRVMESLQGPSRAHLMGTDALGRDTFSRLLHGARISLAVGVFTQAIVLVIGGLVGSMAAMSGRLVDNLLMRFTDIVYAFPDLLLIILMSQVLRNAPVSRVAGGIFVIFFAVAVASWVTLARLVRGQLLSLRGREFVTAARALGATDLRVLRVHLLPNTLSPVIVALTFGVPGAIFAEAALSYIGVGIKPPTPSWGVMINQGYNTILATPWPVFFPGITVAITLLAFTFVGDGLRDALDPRAK